MKIHVRTVHEGRRDYKCDSCGTLFKHPIGLRRHIVAIHEGRKDHKCDICGKEFAYQQHMYRHKKTVHALTKPSWHSTNDT